MDYLAGTSPFSDREAYPFPFLLLLDLKMPLKHGCDVLRWIRTEAPATVRLLPTLLLSSSSRAEDVELGYQFGANAFLTKPTTVEAMVAMVRAIESFWINQNCFSDRRPRPRFSLLLFRLRSLSTLACSRVPESNRPNRLFGFHESRASPGR